MKFTFSPESRPLDGYTIKRAIHRGGFGEVYYALSDAGREVALKLLQHNAEVELRGVQQCLNLSHPNLVTIFDIRQDGDGDHWIIMEYVSGETLDEAIRRHPQGMPMEQVRRWMAGICGGIGFLHSRGLVHRDLKPANIFIEDKTVKIGDVGLSKFITASRRSAQTQSVGTVYYMAPEVAKGRYGKEVDVYSLGIILYELLTGHVPFDGESTGEILMKHLTEKPDLQKLPPRMRGVVAKALEKEPERRYSSVDKFLHVFNDALLGKVEPIDIPGANPPPPPVPALHETLPGPLDSVGGFANSRYDLLPVVRRFAWWGLLGVMVLTALLSMRLGDSFRLGAGEILLLLGIGVLWLLFYSWRRQAGIVSQPAAPWREAVASPMRSIHERIVGTSYFAAAFAAVPFTAILTALLVAIKPTIFMTADGTHPAPEVIGLFVTVALAGAWGMLALAEFRLRRHRPDQSARIPMAMLGCLLGLLAWGVDEYLLIDLSTDGPHYSQAMFSRIGDQPLFLPNSGPTLLGYVAFFGLLFFARDWALMVRAHRESQFRVAAVAWTVCVAGFVTQVVPFSIPLAMAWGAVLSCVVQLAGPWNPRTPHGAKLN